MDCKINDIGFTNRAIAKHYFSLGFDAVTANPFVGWVGGLDTVFESAKEHGAGVILLVHMSHPGSVEGYGQTVISSVDGETTPQYLVFAKKALTWNADGIVVGATFIERLEEIYRVVKGKISIYCPGVGAQGGKITESVRSGADYFIVGRTIYNSDNPGKVTEELRKTSVAQC
jgi:orotidine-5'-phosphate decarboxylase